MKSDDPDPTKVRPLFDHDGDLADEPTVRFPVLYLEMEPHDKGWPEGYRLIVEQLDEEQHYFSSKKRGDEFIIREGMQVIRIKQMWNMRERGATY